MSADFALFPSRTVTATGAAVRAAAGGMNTWLDLNADGWDDFLFTGAFYPNQGSATQASEQPGWLALASADGLRIATQAEFPGATLATVHAREIVSADFNGDRIPDLFIADHGYDGPPFPGHVNHLYLSDGEGRWRNASATLPQVADFTHSAAAADVDGDGDIDLFAGNTVLGQAYLLINDGRGQFSQQRGTLPSTGTFANLYFESCLFVDLDGDGLLELVLGCRAPMAGAPLVLWNHGGTWASGDATSLPVPAAVAAESTVLDIQSTDVNFDGRPDLLMNYQTANGGWQLSILVNDGHRQFTDQTAKVLVVPEPAAGGLNSATVQPSLEFLRPLDLNGDGRTDFYTTPVALRNDAPNRGVPVFLVQREDGRFDVVTTGNLIDAGLDRNLLGGLEYAVHGLPREGALTSHYQIDSTVYVNAQVLQWTPAASSWHAGTAAPDTLIGSGGADWFGPLGGDDRVEGGPGIDLVRLAVPRVDATLTRTAEGWEVQSSAEGRDTLIGIERVWFADGHWALDLDSNAGLVARLLGTLFGRAGPANTLYAGIGLALRDAGTTPLDLAALAIGTDAFAQAAGGRSNAQFVERVYRNVVGSAPSAAEQALYQGLLDSGEFSQASLAVLAANTELLAHQIGLAGLAEQGLPYEPFGT